MTASSRRVLPGFRLGIASSLLYLSVIVLIPLIAGIFKAFELSWSEFCAAVWTPQAVAAYRLTFVSAFQAATINVFLGLIVAWTLVRYDFFGKRFIDCLIDVPFALPTAVAGMVYARLYLDDGWFGRVLVPLGFEATYTRVGIVLVLVFTGFPFVVRTVQPVLEDLDAESEQASDTLGASRWETFRRVIFPILIPPALTGFTLAFARAIGEYGSIIFMSSNKPFETEIAPWLIVTRLEEFRYREASAIALVLIVISFLSLIAINLIERWSQPGGTPRVVRATFGVFLSRLFGLLFFLCGFALRPLSRLPLFRGNRIASILPGVLQLFTIAVVVFLILVPLVNVFAQAFSKGIVVYCQNLFLDPDTRHSIFLTLTIAPVAVAMNTLFGIAAAYTIARFQFPGRTLLTTLIDLPFSVSPVVAGLVFVLLFGLRTPLGNWLHSHGYQVIFAPPSMLLVTAFVTFPFVARELIPVLEALGAEEEIAARSLGASGWQMFWRITMPNIKWGLVYGVILCNARAMGEFGAIYIVSGRVTGQTDTMPLRIEKLNQEYNRPGAFALASLLTLLALITLALKIFVEKQLEKQVAESKMDQSES
jgi:sulfate ABC transporter permease protein CysW/sulfate ABC transporter permease protein CysT